MHKYNGKAFTIWIVFSLAGFTFTVVSSLPVVVVLVYVSVCTVFWTLHKKQMTTNQTWVVVCQQPLYFKSGGLRVPFLVKFSDGLFSSSIKKNKDIEERRKLNP